MVADTANLHLALMAINCLPRFDLFDTLLLYAGIHLLLLVCFYVFLVGHFVEDEAELAFAFEEDFCAAFDLY